MCCLIALWCCVNRLLKSQVLPEQKQLQAISMVII